MDLIDFGTGPNTGDNLRQALEKLQAGILALEAGQGGNPNPAPVFVIQPSISPTSGAAGTTFTANDGQASNATGYTRRWLLDGTSIGTGTTVVPVVAGSLVLEVTAENTVGMATATSAAVGVTSAPVSPALNALTLSGALVNGTASSGTINGATNGSTITSNLTGLTVNSAARTYSFNGTAAAGTTANALTETLAGATNSPRNSTVTVVSGSIMALTDPIMFVVGASLEALSYRGTQSPYSYGYSAQGPINWLNYLSPKRLFTVQQGVSRGSFPWYSRPSASASGSASFTSAGNSGPSINGQVDQVLSQIANVPAGRQICVYYTGGRNALENSDNWLAKEMANIDKLLAEPRVSLVLVPGLWKRDSRSGGDWASGGVDRARVDQINSKFPALIAARGSRAAFMPLQDVIADPNSAIGDPKAGYSVDFIHYATKGSQAAASAEVTVANPYFAGVDRTSGTNLLATTGSSGTVSNGVTGTLPTGYTATKDPTVSVAVSTPITGRVSVAVTRAETQATAAEGATITSAPVSTVDGGTYRGYVKVTIPATTLPISLAAYLIDQSSGANQRVYAIYPNHVTSAGGVFTQTASTAIDPLDASGGLTLYLETMQDMTVASGAGASIAMVVTTSVNQGVAETYTVNIDEWRITKIADAAVTPAPSPTPTPSPTPVAYTAWTGPGWFDASETAGGGAAMTTFTNKNGGGDLSKVGTGTITTVSAAQNGRNVVRVVRDVSSSAAVPHLAASTNSAISTMWAGDDQPFVAIIAYKPTDTNTGYIFASAIDSGSNLDHIAYLRRSGTASSVRKKSGSATQIDVSSSPAAGNVADTPVVVAIRHNGTTVDIWNNSTTKFATAAAQDTAAIGTPQLFRLFANKVNGNILATQCSMDFYEGVFDTATHTDTEIQNAITLIADKWGITLS